MSRTLSHRFPLADVPAPNLSDLSRRTGYPLENDPTLARRRHPLLVSRPSRHPTRDPPVTHLDRLVRSSHEAVTTDKVCARCIVDVHWPGPVPSRAARCRPPHLR